MKSKWNSLVVGGCNVLGLALLALSVTAGGSAVRAAGDSPSLESVALESFTEMVSAIERRAAALETSVTAFAHSFTAQRIAAQELCIADESGAQTCITKMQLDALLKSALKTTQAEPVTAAEPVQATEAAPAAEPAPAAATEITYAAPEAAHESAPVACSEKCVAPTAAEPPAAATKEAAPVDESPALAIKETTPAEERPAVPDEPDEHQAADREAGTVSAEAVIPAPLPKPAETQPEAVVSTSTAVQQAAVVPAEPAAKAKEPETDAPATTGAAPAEPQTAPSEESSALESRE